MTKILLFFATILSCCRSSGSIFSMQKIFQLAQARNFGNIIAYAEKLFCFHNEAKMVHTIPLLNAAARQIVPKLFPRNAENSRGKPEKLLALLRICKRSFSFIHWMAIRFDDLTKAIPIKIENIAIAAQSETMPKTVFIEKGGSGSGVHGEGLIFSR